MCACVRVCACACVCVCVCVCLFCLFAFFLLGLLYSPGKNLWDVTWQFNKIWFGLQNFKKLDCVCPTERKPEVFGFE